ncbi:MAG: hypothetical protein ACI9MC_001226 [Kiritimatiellia bacterium]|jgi:uncharacterized protein (TIGR02421 family)
MNKPLSEPLLELDRATVKLAKKVRVLSTLKWPLGTRDRFVTSWERGDPVLPERAVGPDLSDLARQLRHIAGNAVAEHPAHMLVSNTASSYARAADLLGAMGTPDFSEVGRELYGHPDDSVYPGGASHLETAQHLLAATEGLATAPNNEDRLSDEHAAEWMREHIAQVFDKDGPVVQIDPELDALAAAGAIRVRLRGGARFSPTKLRQLLEHEVYVHSGTKYNGKAQPLGVLAMSSPRTTATQEGLATLAELLTDTMDLRRLRRIALRVVGLAGALDGADLVQTAQIFLDGGQSRNEAAASALRLFRGGDPKGKIVFLKDVVYLAGLLSVETFLLKAFQTKRHTLPSALFAGRMTVQDAIALEPLIQAGVLRHPIVVPRWISNPSSLAAQLALSTFHKRRDLATVRLDQL